MKPVRKKTQSSIIQDGTYTNWLGRRLWSKLIDLDDSTHLDHYGKRYRSGMAKASRFALAVRIFAKCDFVIQSRQQNVGVSQRIFWRIVLIIFATISCAKEHAKVSLCFRNTCERNAKEGKKQM